MDMPKVKCAVWDDRIGNRVVMVSGDAVRFAVFPFSEGGLKEAEKSLRSGDLPVGASVMSPLDGLRYLDKDPSAVFFEDGSADINQDDPFL